MQGVTSQLPCSPVRSFGGAREVNPPSSLIFRLLICKVEVLIPASQGIMGSGERRFVKQHMVGVGSLASTSLHFYKMEVTPVEAETLGGCGDRQSVNGRPRPTCGRVQR